MLKGDEMIRLIRTRVGQVRESGPAGIVTLFALATLSSGCSYNQFVAQEEAIKTQWA